MSNTVRPAGDQDAAEIKTTGNEPRRNGHHPIDEKSDERRFRRLIKALTAAGRGDFSVRLPISHKDKLLDQLAMKFNAVVERNEAITSEIVRVEQALRREGRMAERATVKGAIGGWREIEGSINSLINLLANNLTARQAGSLRQRDSEAFERRSELRFRSLMDALPQCVWVGRADQTFYYWNKRAADYTGLQASVAIGVERLFDFVHPDDVETIKSEWLLATSLQHSAEVRVRVRRHTDGAYRWFLVRAVPQRDESRNFSGWIVAATDIDTEHQALEEAEGAGRMKQEFLATVSHELRNPLNAIVGWIHLLRSGSLDPVKSSKALETIERNVHLQTALIDDILDLSRIIRGKVSLSFRTVRMSAVIDAALAAVRPTADAKGVALEYEMAAESDEIRGDADRLQQIVWNLLSNAIKFTPRDGRVTVRMEQHEHELKLTVRDTGQGISPNFLPHVFDRFSQADGGSTRAHGGLGLGLAIVRDLVELHAGTVEAMSAGPGQGATFAVRLPIRESRALTAGNDRDRTAARASKLEGVSILVVDDEPDSREVLAEVLRQYGAHTRTASSAYEALSEIDRATPQVLLSDIGMPLVDGYELIRGIRQRIPEKEMIALALTGLSSGKDKERALAEGFQQCLVKPVEPELLVDAIERLLFSQQHSAAP